MSVTRPRPQRLIVHALLAMSAVSMTAARAEPRMTALTPALSMEDVIGDGHLPPSEVITSIPPRNRQLPLTTRWGQAGPYRVWLDDDRPVCEQNPHADEWGDRPYYVGCLTVAVGQLINYHLGHAHTAGGQHIVRQGAMAFPRLDNGAVSACPLEAPSIKPPAPEPTGYASAMSHGGGNTRRDSAQDTALRQFLWQVALALDPLLSRGKALFGTAREDTEAVKADRLKRLLRDRFGFGVGDLAAANSPMPALVAAQEVIRQDIDSGNPLLVLMLGRDPRGRAIGHAAIIDGYRERADGGFDTHINFGWGDADGSNAWYPGEGAITVRKFTWQTFTVIGGLHPPSQEVAAALVSAALPAP